jgi:hypothetical protein
MNESVSFDEFTLWSDTTFPNIQFWLRFRGDFSLLLNNAESWHVLDLTTIADAYHLGDLCLVMHLRPV